MNENKELAVTILFAVACIAVLVAVLTCFSLWNFQSECASNGGSHSMEGGTAYCDY